MIIQSLDLALAIVASLLCLVFCVLAIKESLRGRRLQGGQDLVAKLDAERGRQERRRMQGEFSGAKY